jgi:hypothetical protein
MGAAESLSLAITTQTTGTAEVEKLVSALNKYIDKVQEAKDKSEKGPNPASWEAFAGHVKDAIQNPLQTAGNAAEGMLKTLGPLGTGLVATAGGMAAAGAAALSVARQMGELGLSIHNTSLRMGLTTREVGQFTFAAQAAGSDIGSLEGAMRKLSLGLAESGEEGDKARRGLAALGVSARDAHGEIRPTSEVLLDISKGLNSMGSAAERNAAAVRIFGRAGVELIPVLSGLSEHVERAKELGLGLDEKTVRQLDETHQILHEIGASWESLLRQPKIILTLELRSLLKWFRGDSSEDKGPMTPMEKEVERRRREYDNGPQRKLDDLKGDLALYENRSDPLAQARTANLKAQIAELQDQLSGNGKRILQQALAGVERGPGGLEKQLAAAKKHLAEVQTTTEGMALNKDGTLTPAAQNQKLILDDALRQVQRLQALSNANKDAAKALTESKSGVEALEKRADEEGYGILAPVKKAIDEYQALAAKIRKVADPKVRADLEARAHTAYSRVVIPLARTASDKEREMWANLDKSEEERRYKRTNELMRSLYGPGLKDDEARFKADEQIERISISTARENITRESSKATRLAELRAPIGMEDQAALAGIQERKRLAQELYDFEMKESLKIEDLDERRVTQAKALADQRRMNLDAELEAEVKIAEMRRQQVENARNMAGSFYDAMRSNKLPDFFRQQGDNLLKGIFVNATSGIFQQGLGMLGQVGKSSGLGGLLTGTLLDPKNAPMAANTLALTGTTRALNTLTSVLTGTPVSGTVTGGATAGFGGALQSGIGGSGASGASGFGGILGAILGIGKASGVFGGGSRGGGVFSLSGSTGGGSYGVIGADGVFNQVPYGTPKGDYAVMRADGTMGTFHSPGLTGKYNSVEGALFDPNAGTGAKIGSAVATAGAVYGGVMGIMGGVKQGGARGTLTAIGAGAGAAAALDPEPISKAVLAGVALVSGMITGIMGDPRQNRQNQLNNELTDWHYFQPQALSSMMDGSGNLVNYDARGNVRSTPYDGWRFDVTQSHYGSPVNGQPTPIPGGAQPVYIYAMDAQSFAQFATNNRGALANAQYQAIQEGHPLVQAIRAVSGTA